MASQLDHAATLDCVHCGLCLPVCPTYQETGRESSSPRGRIYLMRAVGEGRLELDREVADEMYFCLACRACESACPAGVRYGHLIETMRAEIDARGARPWLARTLERIALRRVLASPRVLRLAAQAARVYQRKGLQRLLQRSRLFALAPRLREADRALPPLPDRHEPPILVPAVGTRRGRVALFAGCVMPEMFGAVNEATIRVLAENGFEVHIPRGQRCCGALHLHAGDARSAERLRLRNRSVFHVQDYDAVIANSAGCGAVLKEGGDDLARAVRDVAEFLIAAVLRPPRGRVQGRVAYDDPCHLLHGQRIAREPRALLTAIPGLEVFELPGSRDCFGAACIYNVTHADMANRLLERKVAAIHATAPDYLATGNPGCLMHIGRGVREAGLAVEVVHPVQLLARAYA